MTTDRSRRSVVCGLIPARGGSRSVPRKNLALVAGRPLIAYTLEAARASQQFDAIFTSTDSEEIATVATGMGSRLIRRPAELAQDRTPMLPVVLHALPLMEAASGVPCDIVVVLQPTSPLRMAEDIDGALTMLRRSHADALVSVYEPPKKYHPQRMKRIEHGFLKPYEATTQEGIPRQLLPTVYKANGAIYAVRRRTLVEQQSLEGRRTLAYLMPIERSLDIDDVDDLRLAEWRLGELAGAVHVRSELRGYVIGKAR